MAVKLMENVSVEELPNHYKKLLDPSEPFRQSLGFFPDKLDVDFSGLLPCIVFGGFTVIYILYWIIQLPRFISDGINMRDIVFGIPLTVVPGLLTLYCFKQLKKQKKNYTALDRGEWRIGWFLTKDAMLYYDGKKCTLVPRKSIFEIRIDVSSMGEEIMDEEHCAKYYGDGYWSWITLPYDRKLEPLFLHWWKTGKPRT